MKHSDHQTLYRKYRPSAFAEVLGQEHITKVLEGEIQKNTIAHAYLFSGPRGTGKTSTARIFAKAIGTSEKDLYEMDAASNRKIDEIRELREAVLTLPFESPRKVYILDEVHMLTAESFNAFLKTLEEPPSHVVFILATTDLDKVPETIQSRCETFTFRKPSREVLTEMILKTAKKEGATLEPSSADLIAILADGSFRDAHGILQKVLASGSDKKISPDEVAEVTGAPKHTLVNSCIEAISSGNQAGALEAIETAAGANVDIRLFLRLVLEKSRSVLLLRFANDLSKSIESKYSAEDVALLKKIAGDKTSLLTSSALSELLLAYSDLSYVALPELRLELALLTIFEKSGK